MNAHRSDADAANNATPITVIVPTSYATTSTLCTPPQRVPLDASGSPLSILHRHYMDCQHRPSYGTWWKPKLPLRCVTELLQRCCRHFTFGL